MCVCVFVRLFWQSCRGIVAAPWSTFIIITQSNKTNNISASFSVGSSRAASWCRFYFCHRQCLALRFVCGTVLVVVSVDVLVLSPKPKKRRRTEQPLLGVVRVTDSWPQQQQRTQSSPSPHSHRCHCETHSRQQHPHQRQGVPPENQHNQV